jgi:hypothetical protein
LSTLIDRHGRLQYSDPSALRRALRLPAHARLLLSGVTPDTRLEKFWRRSERDGYWPLIQRLRFSAATSFTFSVWGNDPRFDQLYNQARNEVTFEILNSLGIPTILFFFCSAPEDYSRAASWMEARSLVSVIAVFATYCDTARDLEVLLKDSLRLAALAKRDLRHMIVGVATKEKIDCARALIADPIIVTAQPVAKAIRDGAEANESLLFEKVPGAPKGELIAKSVARYQACLN